MNPVVRNRKKAGHRSWAPQNAPIPGGHRGDVMSTEKRSALMARIRSKDTGPERVLGSVLKKLRVRFDVHVRTLPGRPDFVVKGCKIAIFVDGDFWHGWRFPLWKGKLAQKWKEKIEANRARDKRNFRRLRRLGWRVIRIWEHQIEQNCEACVRRIALALAHAR